MFRSEIGLSPSVSTGSGWNLQLLSGGHRILFAGGEADERQLWVRDLSELTSIAVAGTQGADLAAVSPDEHWFAFFADNVLKKISVNGGEPIILAETTDSPHGASFRAETPVEVLAGNLLPISGISRRYDLARDCRVIAVLERDQQEASEPPRTIIVLNWFEELKQRSR